VPSGGRLPARIPAFLPWLYVYQSGLAADLSTCQSLGLPGPQDGAPVNGPAGRAIQAALSGRCGPRKPRTWLRGTVKFSPPRVIVSPKRLCSAVTPS
jgi:hypothetical protein